MTHAEEAVMVAINSTAAMDFDCDGHAVYYLHVDDGRIKTKSKTKLPFDTMIIATMKDPENWENINDPWIGESWDLPEFKEVVQKMAKRLESLRHEDKPTETFSENSGKNSIC